MRETDYDKVKGGNPELAVLLSPHSAKIFSLLIYKPRSYAELRAEGVSNPGRALSPLLKAKLIEKISGSVPKYKPNYVFLSKHICELNYLPYTTVTQKLINDLYSNEYLAQKFLCLENCRIEIDGKAISIKEALEATSNKPIFSKRSKGVNYSVSLLDLYLLMFLTRPIMFSSYALHKFRRERGIPIKLEIDANQIFSMLKKAIPKAKSNKLQRFAQIIAKSDLDFDYSYLDKGTFSQAYNAFTKGDLKGKWKQLLSTSVALYANYLEYFWSFEALSILVDIFEKLEKNYQKNEKDWTEIKNFKINFPIPIRQLNPDIPFSEEFKKALEHKSILPP